MKKLAAALVLAGACLAGCSVWAQEFIGNQGAVRGVAYEGKLHYLSDYVDGKDLAMGYFSQDVDTDNWQGPWWPWNQFAAADEAIKIPSGYDLQYADAEMNEYGQGVVLYGALLINAAVVLNSKGDPWVMVTAFDLNTQKFVTCKTVCPLGYTNSSTGYGVAAVVLDSTVYLFTRNFLLVSEDGVNYTQTTSPLAAGLSDCEPLDAVTFYPAEGPKVLVAFSKISDKDPRAAYVVWDGATLPMDSSEVRLIGDEGNRYFCGATMLGTVKGTEYGMSCEFPSGSKHPCVQILLWGYTVLNGWLIERHEYDTIADSVSAQGLCAMDLTVTQLRVYPWFETQKNDTTGFWAQQQLIVLNTLLENETWANLALSSDFMVPQNQDPSTNGFGWQGIPTNTECPAQCTPDEEAQWRTYWSLIGVVLGPPPFATNGIDPSDQNHTMQLSNVLYGYDSNHTVSQSYSWSNTVMFSVGGGVLAGPSKDAGSLFNLDLSYKHGWSGKQSETTRYSASGSYKMGTQDQNEGNLGKQGWAVFVVPVLVTQEMWLYAYDYDFDKNTGTLLGQELTTVAQAQPSSDDSPPGIGIVVKYFSLKEPGGTSDQVLGLMTMQIDPDTGQPYTFPESTDLDGWNSTVWEPTNSKWKVLYGTSTGGGQEAPILSLGTVETVEWTQNQDSVTAQGYTNATSVSIGSHFGDFLKLLGFDGSLTAGYSSECTNETTNVSAVNQNIQLSFGMPSPPDPCTGTGTVYYTDWTVQPYLLQALDSSAPWIPQNYGLNLPWCITWYAKGTVCGGGQTGTSPQPDDISGHIAGPGSGDSSYAIRGGRLAWIGDGGGVTPIPITADTFDPGMGATLELNKHVLYATPSAGKWTRQGQVWKFKSKGASGKNLLTLKLDFGSGIWSFEGKKLALAGAFKPSDSHVMARLRVNGLYTFRFDAEQEVRSEWKLVLAPSDPQKLEVTRVEGRFGWSDRKARAVLEGRLPAALTEFGDLSLVFNGHQRDIPLLALGDYPSAFAQGKQLIYKSGGTKVVVDFGKKTWSADFEGEDFHRLMAPRWGGVRLAVKAGGRSLYTAEHAVTDFRTELKFKG
jgi:hypothetical protein